MTESMRAWEFMLNKTSIARYFSGIFNELGIYVRDTGEEFTVIHKVDRFEMKKGLMESCDYVVEITSQNVANMSSHGKDDAIDADESFRIMSVLFTPLTEASLKNPLLSKPFYRMLAGIENHIIVYLEHPTKELEIAHTIIYLNKEWMVIPGAHGNARRIFRLNPSQAVDYQKHVFAAIQAGSLGEWQSFKKWYLDWRKSVSITK